MYMMSSSDEETDTRDMGPSRHGPIIVMAEPSKLQIFRGKDGALDDFEADLHNYFRAHRVTSMVARMQVLMRHLSDEVKDELLCHPEEKRKSIDSVIAILRSIYGKCKGVTQLLSTFQGIKQRPNEGIREYSSRLNKAHLELTNRQAEANQSPLSEQVLRDHFVQNLRNEGLAVQLHEKVLDMPTYTFYEVREMALRREEAVDRIAAGTLNPEYFVQTVQPESKFDSMAKALEAVVKELKDVKQELQEVKNGSKGNRKLGGRGKLRWDSDGKPICFKCQIAGHLARDCPQEN